jgi:hypothetical protein
MITTKKFKCLQFRCARGLASGGKGLDSGGRSRPSLSYFIFQRAQQFLLRNLTMLCYI